ncbi:LysR substrate-binding domain-containing protein [Pseudomonas aeruginosa]
MSAQIRRAGTQRRRRVVPAHAAPAHLERGRAAAVRNAAEQILALFDGIGQGDSPRGRLRIGAVNTAQTGLLPEVLKRLAEQAPHIEPQVVPGVSLHLLDRRWTPPNWTWRSSSARRSTCARLSAQRVERQPFV